MKKIIPFLILVLILLQACSLPKKIGNIPAVETPTATPLLLPTQTASEVPQNTPKPTPKNFDSSPVQIVASDDTKIEALSTAVMQTDPPPWFRKLVVYPVGGIEGWPYCENFSETPFFLNAPATFYALSSDPWNENRIDTCGWGDKEKVTITVTNPDGTQEISSQTFEDGQGVSYRPEMKYGMQLGEYSITFESPSGTLTSRFEILAPNQPGIVEAAEKKYFIYGFEPGEHVYILAYVISQSDRTIRMTTWVETTLDARGELILYNKNNADLLAVVGDSNGLYWNNVFWGIFIGDKVFFKNFESCAGAPASRLQPYDMAYVLEGSPNNVRSSPSISADLVGTVMPGTVLYVGKKDPVCADGYLWWYVYPKVGLDPTGWTAEGKGSVYWLAPAE